METISSWTQILGAALLGVAFFFFIILPALWKLGCFLFSPKIKVIKGKTIGLIVGKTILRGEIINLIFYLAIEDCSNGRVKQIKISKEVFTQLNKDRKFFLNKNILLYFKEYLFGDSEKNLDHYEIA